MKKLFIFLNFINILLTGHYAFAQCYTSEPVISVDGVEIYDGAIIELCAHRWINLEGSAPNVGNGETAEWSGSVGLVSTTPLESITFDYRGDYDATWTFKSSTPGCNQTSSTVTFRVKDVPAPPVITGRTEVCEDSEESYSVAPIAGLTAYIWSVSNQAFLESIQGGAGIEVEFLQQSTQSGTTGEPVIIEVTAENICGQSDPATMEVQVNLAPRAADYTGSEIGLKSLAGSICETDLDGHILETNPAGSNHSTYRWSYDGNVLGETTADEYPLSPYEIGSIYIDRNVEIMVEYGNECGYYEANPASATGTTQLVTQKPFAIDLSLAGETPIDTIIDQTLYAICGLEDTYTISVSGAPGVDLTGVEVGYRFNILGTQSPVITIDGVDNGVFELQDFSLADGQITVEAEIDPDAGCFTKYRDEKTITLRDYTFDKFSIVGPSSMCEGDEPIILSLSDYQSTADGRHNKIDTVMWTLGNGVLTYGSSVEIGSQEEAGEISVKLINDNNCQVFTQAENAPFYVDVKTEIECDKPVGLNDDLTGNEINVFPNPFSNTFQLTGLDNVEKVEVFSSSGQKIKSYMAAYNLGADLPEGHYLLKVYTPEGLTIKKLIKQ